MTNSSDSLGRLFDLSGRLVLMAGGAGHLGLPACEALARHGAKIVIADNRLDAAGAGVELLRGKGFQAEAVAMDLAEESSVHEAVEQVRSRHGRLDVAINSTAYTTGKSLEQMTAQEWEAGLRVCLTGAFVFSREAGRVMVELGGGSIIQFGSMYGMVSPDPRAYIPPMGVNPPDYGAAKAGVMQLVRYQAVMWGPKKVRVNAIVPGPFPNGANYKGEEAFLDRLAKKVPMGRVGKSHEVAGAAVFLASDASSFVTGTQIVVDGGWTAW
ncbi:MAG: SDR family oxidoreductase [Phycisphaerales bacterium]|jgi:NAD(P)-dependent dehydrogenase (short-subunit alcohol dehydrogenase family)|nr:SDR family oxidoreductase [Phycisphaerales bacterium]